MISIENLNFSYRRGSRALNDLSVEIGHNTITGLFGRNGSGKSTLGMLIAGLLPIWRSHGRATGKIFIDGHPVDENPEVMPGVAYIPARVEALSGSPLTLTMDLWRMARPTWDEDFARELFELFELNPSRTVDGLSVGQRSLFSAILGLAARCPITVFDEVHLGMDAVMRELFYRVLLSDFAEHPRTIILSSHLLEEVENLVDSVVFLHRGKLLEAGDADEVRARHSTDSLASLTDVLVTTTLSPAQRERLARPLAGHAPRPGTPPAGTVAATGEPTRTQIGVDHD